MALFRDIVDQRGAMAGAKEVSILAQAAGTLQDDWRSQLQVLLLPVILATELKRLLQEHVCRASHASSLSQFGESGTVAHLQHRKPAR
jgi:hypothetical protein